jgi:hypothetical protein
VGVPTRFSLERKNRVYKFYIWFLNEIFPLKNLLIIKRYVHVFYPKKGGAHMQLPQVKNSS